MIVRETDLLELVDFLRRSGYHFRRHYNEFYIFNRNRFIFYLLYRKTTLMEIYLPKWSTSDEILQTFINNLKKVFPELKVKVFK
ncbi:MAG: hypothetical protein ACP6IS_03205 [Candidatus Asgardarchaeia archaeon]